MITCELLEGWRPLIKHHSDADMLIQKVGTDERYAEAVDILELNEAGMAALAANRNHLSLAEAQENGYLALNEEGEPYCRFEYEETDEPIYVEQEMPQRA